MKKKLLTIMALLCAFVSAQADGEKTSWDFTSLGNDKGWNISWENTNWTLHKTGYYYYASAIKGEQLTIDGTNSITQAEGLYFTIDAYSGGNSGNIRIFKDKLGLYGTKSTVTIQNVGVGKMITIDYETSNTDNAATISFTNATTYANNGSTERAKVFAIASSEDASATSVNVTFGINKGIYIYSINISDNTYTNLPTNNEVSIDINSYGRQTYSSEYPLDFSNTGVDAYIATSTTAATGDNNATVTLTKVTAVPASTGVILKTNDDTKKGQEVTVPVSSMYEVVETNLLVAAAKEATVPASTTGAYTYIYGYDKSASDIASTIGFYQCTSDYTLTTTATGTEGRAYLLTTDDLLANTSGDGAKFVTMDFGDGETTGISNVKANKVDDDAYYTLSGVKVAQPRKGLYIKNGKKVIVK